jgi:hypothetical protein
MPVVLPPNLAVDGFGDCQIPLIRSTNLLKGLEL